MTIPAGVTRWGFPTSVWFGAGVSAELANAVAALGAKRPLLVTDRGLAGSPMVADALSRLDRADLAPRLFCDVKPNPTASNVEAGIRALEAGHHDLVIAWGGGSGMDAAKAIALMAGQHAPMWDFEDVGENWKRVDSEAMLPVIAVPTTAGTGSELGRSSVITDEQGGRKVIIFHPKMLPDLVLMDPGLTVGLPRHLTAATGMDALTHALEAYCAPSFHPMAEGLALQALTMIKEHLPRACANGADIDARAQMMVASGMACVALQKGLGAVHALAHPLGALYDAHHGLLNAVLLPYVLRFNMPVLAPKLTRLAGILDLRSRTPAAVLDWVLALRREIGIPDHLRAIGIDSSRSAEVAALAERDPCAGGNPIPLTQPILASIFDSAVAGSL
ncbi:MAG TPA: iron-containing alcohol dehydrogenase [Steroidobacteraceae bacterium]|nr:iron-containing alcohol dehydrogenase [Steroidobacteraceae bacterium]